MVYHRRLAAPLIAGLLIVSFLRFSAPVEAQAAPPITVNVGAYVINISSFDVGKGTFSADFYLWFSWNGNWSAASNSTAPFPSGFELMNGDVTKTTQIEADQNINGTGENYIIYRIQATMNDPVNLQDYPFDRHNLTIEFEDQDHTVKTLVYQPNPETRIDPLVKLQGWILQPAGVGAYVTYHFYNTTFGYPGQTSAETYSRFIVTMPIGRPVASAIAQTFTPNILILLIAMVSFFLKMEYFGTRVSLNVLSLLTAAAFQITLTSGLPQFGFLTLSDRLMISLYVLLVYALLVTLGRATITGPRRMNIVRELNDSGWIIFPSLAALLIIVQFLI